MSQSQSLYDSKKFKSVCCEEIIFKTHNNTTQQNEYVSTGEYIQSEYNTRILYIRDMIIAKAQKPKIDSVTFDSGTRKVTVTFSEMVWVNSTDFLAEMQSPSVPIPYGTIVNIKNQDGELMNLDANTTVHVRKENNQSVWELTLDITNDDVPSIFVLTELSIVNMFNNKNDEIEKTIT